MVERNHINLSNRKRYSDPLFIVVIKNLIENVSLIRF